VGFILDEVSDLSTDLTLPARAITLGSTQPLTETSTKNLDGSAKDGQMVCKADNLTTICEPTVYKMWEPQSLITLWASMACYRDSFTFLV
jgi:hypothetical protein